MFSDVESEYETINRPCASKIVERDKALRSHEPSGSDTRAETVRVGPNLNAPSSGIGKLWFTRTQKQVTIQTNVVAI